MRFTWIGGATFLLELGAFRLLFDPVFADRFALGAETVTRRAPLPPVDVAGADAVCLTCLRADHCEAEALARSGATMVVAPRASAIPEGAGELRELGWEESVSLERPGERLTVTAVAARPESGDDNGYFLRHEAGGRAFTAHVTGDARFSEGLRAIQRAHGHANLLVLYLGAEGAPAARTSLDGADAMQFVYRMQPNAIAAVHHHTFSHYTEPLDAFLEPLGRTIYDRRLRILREGESFEK
ncbi:MAG: MBL fold metallo-hydrolase [Candidatus Krumholzibacteria bacterium]|nr:MBL fold metallo-hydrolase [Candidatus Krumholzibacteria bacterium]